ncbi:M23 family metallopeptidase [Curtobacterium ammoniigenes]|uniref:M23 family metallopeptidase n=1 Tax=Curtobacterium ammoniigenes TaxID=395387 RepID=UPI000833EAB1|nr:M23 family metallopeptidase [Curtobacterium ammoniigenes]
MPKHAASTRSRARIRRTGRHIAVAAPLADRRQRVTPVRRPAVQRILAPGAAAGLALVAAFLVATTVPAEAVTPSSDPAALRLGGGPSDQVVSGRALGEPPVQRDGYTVVDGSAGRSANTFTNDPTAAIQWPFLTGVPITSGFGARSVAGCSFCSTSHPGVDFAPGAGVPIRAIAGGVVTRVQAHDGGYGNDVWVTHDVDGLRFVSVYGHMQDGSFAVTVGQRIAVGAVLGRVGSTGNSTGPHLHLEVHVNGQPVDPLAWLRAHAGSGSSAG